MKSNQEILDAFGKEIINNFYDDALSYLYQIITNQTKWGTDKDVTQIFNRLSDEEKKILSNYITEILKTSIFSILGIFEENEQFKLIFEENGKQINLVEISEMLKAEPLGEDGWIQRFSKYTEKKGE